MTMEGAFRQSPVTHIHSTAPFEHRHDFLGADHDRNATRVWAVVALTVAMMILEIGGGTLFGSLALVADGWHMSTHAAALTISALAYVFARRHADDPRFAFGTGKVGDLASFASAIVLGMIALLIAYESVDRLFHPAAIVYNEAIAIAALGLAVNLVSAWLLRDDHTHHEHGHDHHHHPHHHETDLNLRSAYVHVLADAVTSLLAIGGLLLAKFQGWTFMDPIVGLIGAGVIVSWAVGLTRRSGAMLIDAVPDPSLAAEMKRILESSGDAVSDFHLWRVGPGHYAAMVSLVSDDPQPPEAYKRKLSALPRLSHVTVEVELCRGLQNRAAALN
jgi:cation diffusion facilitator family transporter